MFYPADLAQKHELVYAVEASHHRDQRLVLFPPAPVELRSGTSRRPTNFVFSVKGPRYITHMRKLRDVESALANFFASGVLGLREKLGPILWQFPAELPLDRERFEAFLRLLPHDTSRAAGDSPGIRHPRMPGRSRLATDEERPLRHAVEFRHESFLAARFVAAS